MRVNFDKLKGIVPAVVQDYATGEVLMLGFMNADALQATLRSAEMVFYSRSRRRLWRKGERSGHRLLLRELRVDCDHDALLARVEPLGAGVCHEGYRSCFYRRLEADGSATIADQPTFDPAEVYGRRSEE